MQLSLLQSWWNFWAFAKDMSKATKDQQESKMVVCKMNNGCDNNEAASSASKLSKIGRRIRDSCRQHLRGKHPSGGASSNPEDYGSTPAPNVSQPFTNPYDLYHWKVLTGKWPVPALCTDGLFGRQIRAHHQPQRHAWAINQRWLHLLQTAYLWAPECWPSANRNSSQYTQEATMVSQRSWSRFGPENSWISQRWWVIRIEIIKEPNFIFIFT